MVKTKDMRDRIREIRIKLRKNKKDFAQMLGVSQSTITNWENGNYVPSIENLNKITEITGESFESTLVKNSYDGDKPVYVINLRIINDLYKGHLSFLMDENNNIIKYKIHLEQISEYTSGLTKHEIETLFFIWIDKQDKYIVKRCTEYEGGAMYLVYEDYELKAMDLSDRKENGQSSNFRVVGKLLKLIRELD